MFEDKPARIRISGQADLLSQLDMMIRALLSSPLRNRLFVIGGAIFLVIAATTYAQIRLNRWNQPFYDALARRDMHGFFVQLTVFAVIVGILLVLNVVQRFLSETMKLWLRQGLTQDLVQEWLKPHRAQRLAEAGPIGINPDQRMHEDARHLTELSGDLGVELMQATVLVVTFIGVLWRISGSFSLTVSGHVYVISGYMVWAAFVYAISASLLSYWVGRSLVPRNSQRYQRESELRAALMRTNDHIAAVQARGRSLDTDRRKILDRLNGVLGAMWRLVFGLTNLTWITAGYGWLMLVAPILVAAPAYFSGALTFGGMMMAVGAFNQLQLSLRWYVDNFSSIADWRATLLRVAEFRRALVACDALEPVAEKRMSEASPTALAALPDEALLEELQKQTFRFFWDGAEPASGLARDRNRQDGDVTGNLVAVGGSGFGLMALVVATARSWVSRTAAAARLSRMLDTLERAARYHGVYPHFLDGVSGATIPFGPLDDGGDLVETSLLMMGLLTARRHFDRPEEAGLRVRITALWEEVEWDWHVQPGQQVLTWHWSPQHGFKMNHAIRGWNECLITYVLAAASPRHAIAPEIYQAGFCAGTDYRNGTSYQGIALPLGPHLGGPLFFAHYSFCGLDPLGLSDAHADYWEQNVAHARINLAHCIANPGRFAGYSAECWGLTASDDPSGYEAHAPGNDNGTVSPTAALSSIVYAPREAMRALRHFLAEYGNRIWGRYGFTDAFNPTRGWYADTFLAIDQGPIIVMIENYRSRLLWKLFMAVPEVRLGLSRLGFRFPQDNA